MMLFVLQMEPVFASAFMSLFDTVRKKGIGTDFAKNVWQDWTRGEDFGTGQLGAETNFYTGLILVSMPVKCLD